MDTSQTHLSLLGADTTVNPTASRMPSHFNHAAARLWKQAVGSKELQAVVDDKEKTIGDRWETAVKVYLKLCAKAEVFPFTGKDDFQEMATRFLTNARKTLASYVQESGILKQLTIKSVDREVSFTPQNFSIRVVAKLKPIEDPTLHKWATTQPLPGFRAHAKNLFKKSVHAHVDVEFDNSPTNPTLSYTIICVSPLRLIDPKLTSRAKLESYVTSKLWLPILRSNRIKDAGSRLF